MQKILNKFAAIGAAALFIGGAAAFGRFVCAERASVSAAADYYAPVTAGGGEELLGQLHDLITTTHTNYTNYSASKLYGKTTDPALNGEDGIVEFYTHETIAEFTSNNEPGTWNREHVWAQSLSNGKWGKDGGGSDLHHLRPSEVEMNATRGNDKYGEVSNGSPVYSQKPGGGNSELGGHHMGGVFEPLDNVKGDVARIVLYVYTHYNTYSNVHGTTNGNGSDSYFGTLPITNIISASSEDAAFALLVAWNELDPVDTIETTRNEAVYNIQHNRNPFIDHPEYVRAIWGEGGTAEPDTPPAEPDPADPVTPAGNTVTISVSSFEMQSAQYGFHPWSADGVEGIAYIFGGNTGCLQFNNKEKQKSYYLASTTPTGGAIRSVTVKLKEGETERPWKLLTSDTAYGEVDGKPAEGNDQGTKTVTAEGVTWTVSGSDTYFALTYELEKQGACYLDSIVIEYESKEQDPGETPGGSGEQNPGETPGGSGEQDPGETPGGSGEQDPGETPGGGEEQDPGETPDSGEASQKAGGCKGVIGGAGAAVFATAVGAAAAVLRRRKR